MNTETAKIIDTSTYLQILRVNRLMKELEKEVHLSTAFFLSSTTIIEDYNVSNIQFDGKKYYMNPTDVLNMEDKTIKEMLKTHINLFIDNVPFRKFTTIGKTEISENHELYTEKWPKAEDILSGKVDVYPWFRFEKLFEDADGFVANLNSIASLAIGEANDIYHYAFDKKVGFRRTTNNSKIAKKQYNDMHVVLPQQNFDNFKFKSQLKDIINLATMLSYKISEKKDGRSDGKNYIQYKIGSTVILQLSFIGYHFEEIKFFDYGIVNYETNVENEIKEVLEKAYNYIKGL